MKLQKVLSKLRQMIKDYDLIQENDKIAVGLSGGKDSVSLLFAMKKLQAFYPIHFELVAITVDPGFEDFNLDEMKSLCHKLDVPYYIVPTNLASIVFEHNKDQRPCSLCAKIRKGALNQKLLEIGYNKVAYAHHKDDLIETMMLSMIYEGRFYAFPPKTLFPDTKIEVIRPFLYLNEYEIRSFQKEYNLPVAINPCPVDKKTNREYAKQLVSQINRDVPGAKNRFFTAIVDGKFEDWPPRSNLK